MATIKVNLPPDIVKWCIETFRPLMKVNFEPTESQIITHALYQLRANWNNEEYDIPSKYNEYKEKRKHI